MRGITFGPVAPRCETYTPDAEGRLIDEVVQSPPDCAACGGRAADHFTEAVTCWIESVRDRWKPVFVQSWVVAAEYGTIASAFVSCLESRDGRKLRIGPEGANFVLETGGRPDYLKMNWLRAAKPVVVHLPHHLRRPAARGSRLHVRWPHDNGTIATIKES